MGECYEKKGDNKMAIKQYQKALSNDITLEQVEEKIQKLSLELKK